MAISSMPMARAATAISNRNNVGYVVFRLASRGLAKKA